MSSATVVGRAEELGRILGLLRGARAGRFGVLILEGDAGIGKTTLVRAACDAVGDQSLVLRGACLPLISAASPLIGLRSAVRGLAVEQRPSVLGGPVPSRAAGGGPSVPVPVAVDDWLCAQAVRRAVVLVVEDLHWADEETLDALMYVLAGPSERRLAVVLTVRSTDVGPHHRLQRWLADVRRLPGVEELAVVPLARAEVAAEVAVVLGGPAHSCLVDEVFARGRGNPYFTRLLVTGLGPSTRLLPAHLPAELSAAVARTWGSMSDVGRRLVVALAVGGRPVVGPSLALVADAAGLADPEPALHEALEAGLLDLADDGSFWFHHPLQAEALAQGLLPEEAHALHAAFARGFEELLEQGAGDEPVHELAASVCDHHALADHQDSAFRWAMRAAEAMRVAGDKVGRLRMLDHAIELRPGQRVVEESLVDLLEQARVVARDLGDWDAELRAIEGLRDALRPGTDDLRLAVLDAWRSTVRFQLALHTEPGDLVLALERSASAPDSWQRVVVLGVSARLFLWAGLLEQGRAPVEEGLAVAEAHEGSWPGPHTDEWVRACAYAHGQAAMLAVFDGDERRAGEQARRSAELSVLARDGSALLNATFWGANARPYPMTGWVEAIARGRQQMERVGIPQPFVAWLSGAESDGWFELGEPEACLARLRVALGASVGPAADLQARLAGALLATSQGRQDEAEAHLARARELFAGQLSLPMHGTARVTAAVQLGREDPAAALQTTVEACNAGGVNPTHCEWLAPLAARALADLVQAERDAGRDPAPQLQRLVELRARSPHVLRDTGNDKAYQQMLDALDRLYDAETARARQDPDQAATWQDTVDRLSEVPLPWDVAYACWRAAEALLGRGGAVERRQAAEMLRRGHALAVRLGAEPVRAHLESLAHAARIPLTSVGAVGVRSGGDAVALTPREREVLEHVVAGRTYAEIAAALFLSEKTVSSHISNTLRKTGTANRVALATWAGRRGRSS